MNIFRKAEKRDVPSLRMLAVRSEAVWGFDEQFLRIFDENYNITEQFVENNTSFVLEEHGKILGFWGIIRQKDIAELEFLYVDVKHIGKGVGRTLWNHMVQYCSSEGIKRIEFVTSEPAAAFYLKNGARLNGSTNSSIDGREIPRLFYTCMT